MHESVPYDSEVEDLTEFVVSVFFCKGIDQLRYSIANAYVTTPAQ